jgi:putative thioredoxin
MAAHGLLRMHRLARAGGYRTLTQYAGSMARQACGPRSVLSHRQLSTSSTSSVVELKSAADFETLVRDASSQPAPVGGPVVLDFYADWCGPCKTLTPKLEKMVQAAGGSVRLAKINVDKLPELAQALQVAELPTVMLVHMGKLVDSFKGVLPDAKLKAFIDKAVALAGGSNVGGRVLEDAIKALEANDVPAAAKIFAEIVQLPEHAAAATAGLALCALNDTPPDLSLAQDLVASIPKKYPNDLNKEIVRKAISKVALAAHGRAEGGRSPEELRALLEAAPDANDVRYELAQAMLSAGEEEEAMGELLQIIKQEKRSGQVWNDAAAKTLLLQLFESVGKDHELVKKGRRRLANIVLM